MISFDTIENAKAKIKTYKPKELENNIMTQAAENEMSPSQLIDAVRAEIAELIDSKMSAAKKQAKLAGLEIELYVLRRCYHSILAERRAKSAKKTTKKATRKAS